ncbi:MAG: DUF6152 family protein [Steroidobacteraceae bacterium]
MKALATKPFRYVVLVAGALLGIGITQAHHATVGIDNDARVTLTGTVKKFSFTNPHVWITLVVPNGEGGADDWHLEGGSVSILARNGWRAGTLATGDKVKLLISPRVDKSPGGEFYTILEKNGAPFELPVSKTN